MSPGSTFFLRLCRCCCASWVFPSRSGNASGFRERERGVLGYLNGSVSRESLPLRTEHSERDRMRPDEWMLLTPIMLVRSEFRVMTVRVMKPSDPGRESAFQRAAERKPKESKHGSERRGDDLQTTSSCDGSQVQTVESSLILQNFR